MNAAFLSALKSKASAIQSDRSKQSNEPVNGKTYNLTGSGNSIANGNTWAESEIPNVTVDLVLNRNRIDLKFKDKPNAKILESLRSSGWHYRPSDRAWYHQDTESNREFCRKNFSVDLEVKDPITAHPDHARLLANPEIEDPILSDLGAEKPIEIPEPSDRFSQYKRQVNDLLDYLKIDSADLQLLAISKLHDQVFKA